MNLTEWRAARLAAYRAGAYVMRAPDVCSAHWNERDWCNFVRFNEPALRGFDDGKPKAPPAPDPGTCDSLSLDAVAGVAQALGLEINETRRLLAANQPEDWR